jgi:neopullulanase
MKAKLFSFLFLLTSLMAFAQKPEIKRIDPPFWWNNLNTRNLQLCVYGTNVAAFDVKLKTSDVSINRIEKVENVNYLFVYLDLGKFSGNEILIDFIFEGKAKTTKYKLQTLQKNIDNVNAKDFVYLAFPDRFANGDPKNDAIPTLNEKTASRDTLGARHGGDLKGVLDHVDYLQDLGVTALWLNPTLINDQPAYSYHGYALTDHYRTDPRIGTNEQYKQLGDILASKKMKLIMDLVPNHVGSKHWMVLDMPEKSWLNQWPEFTRTNYRATTHFDPYASEYDKKKMVNGWFDGHMPDLNQTNPRLADYLMQSYLWWINYAGIDGFRIDTYSYDDYGFMGKCMGYIENEYPGFWSTGEVWEQGGILHMAAFTKNNNFKKSPEGSYLTGAKDFHLYWGILEALNVKPKWDSGLARIYYVLSNDGLYDKPELNLTFIDNHDVNRFFTDINQDFAKWKMGLGLLMTTRGIPSIYYGTEVLFTNPLPRINDGQIRQDFPGGWPGDKVNKFTANGRTSQENEAFDYIKKLAGLRKEFSALTTGKLMQFTPEGNHYVYFRYDETATFMVILNRGAETLKLDTKRFAERMQGFTGGEDHANGDVLSNLSTISVEPNSIRIIELQK